MTDEEMALEAARDAYEADIENADNAAAYAKALDANDKAGQKGTA